MITDKVVKQWTPMVAKKCRGVNDNESDIADMVQSVWLAVIECYDSFDETVSTFPTWLGGVAHQQALKWVRDKHPETFRAWQSDAYLMAEDPETLLCLEETKAAWDDALAKDEIARAVLYDLRTYDDVAEEYGLSAYQVRYRVKQLKESLDDR